MSTPKKKPEPVKEPAPKKAVKKKVVKKVEEDEAASRAGMEQMSAVPRIRAAAAQRVAEPEPILPAPEQHGEAVAPVLPKQMPIDNFRPLLEAEPKQPEQLPEVHTTPQKVNFFEKAKSFKYWKQVIGVVAFIIIAWVIAGWVIGYQNRKVVKQTEKVETKTTTQKGELSKTEANLSEMQDIKQKVDRLNIIIDSMQKLASDHAAYEETMHQLNLKYKLRNYELQNQIRTASDDSLRKIVSDLSKQK